MGIELNNLVIGGNLGRDPETRQAGEHTVANFSLALTKRRNGQEETTWVEVECWNRTAELVGQHLTKGSGAIVTGRLRQQNWEDRNTGQKRSKLVVVADTVQFVGGRGNGQGQASQPQQAGPPPMASEATDDDSMPF